MANRQNLFLLHSLGEAYGTRPSDLLGMETPWASWQLDQAALIVGRQVERELTEGKSTEPAPRQPGNEQFRDPRGLRAIKTVKIKPDGTW